MGNFMQRKLCASLPQAALLIAFLLASCHGDIKITTRGSVKCAERPDIGFCKDLERKEVQSLNTLKIEDATVSPDSSVTISTTMAELANSGNQISASLSTDRECQSELQIPATVKLAGVTTFKNVPEGVYYTIRRRIQVRTSASAALGRRAPDSSIFDCCDPAGDGCRLEPLLKRFSS